MAGKKTKDKKKTNAKSVPLRRNPKRGIKRSVTLNDLKTTPVISKFSRCMDWVKSQKVARTKTQHVYSHDSDAESIPEIDPSSSPPPEAKIRSKYTVFIECEWNGCSVESTTYNELIAHLPEHLVALKPIDNKYVCLWDLCRYKADDEILMKRHLYFHAYHTNLKALGESLLSKRSLPPCVIDSRQRNMIPDTTNYYLCQFVDCKCKEKYETIQEYHEHANEYGKYLYETLFDCGRRVRTDTTGKPNKVQCTWIGCKLRFDKRQALMVHIHRHTKEKLFACPQCGQTFGTHSMFYEHYQRQSVKDDHQCPHCFKFFPTENILAAHIVHHVNCYKCSMCDMTCITPNKLIRHIRYRHISEKPFECMQCDFRAKYKYDLVRHNVIHDERIYDCEEFGCNFTSRSLITMKRHHKNIHGLGPNIYCCHCCTKQYKKGFRLSKHLVKEHGFQLPSGHARFTYSQDFDGFYRLQVTRVERLDITEQVMSPTIKNDTKLDDIKLTVASVTETTDGVKILIKEQSLDENVSSCNKLSNSSLVESETETMTDKSVDDTNEPMKNINDFSVMKRYIKNKKTDNSKSKEILITVNDIDHGGKIIRSKVTRASEILIGEK